MILQIDEPGHYISIPKMKPFNTPAKIEFNIKYLNAILMEMRKLGIENFMIYSNESSKKQKYEDTKSIIKEQNKNDDIKNLESRFDIIEQLLMKSLEQNNTSNISSESDNTKTKRKLLMEEDIDDFIPSIDMTGMTLKGSSFKSEKRDSKFKESSNMLSKISK